MTIRDLLEAKAHALAEEMGVTATILHLQAAAHHLAAELRRDLDSLVAEFRMAGTEIQKAITPPAATEASPAGDDPPAAEAAASPDAVTAADPGSEAAPATDVQPAGAA